MFSLFIVLFSFNKSLARDQIKCLFLNDEPCMAGPSLIDMNPVELKYYPLMITLGKCTGSCNVVSPKICVRKEAKHINVKAFNMITNKDEAKVQNKFHVIVHANSIIQHVIQNKTGRIKYLNVKIIISMKKVIVGILAHVFVRIVSI